MFEDNRTDAIITPDLREWDDDEPETASADLPEDDGITDPTDDPFIPKDDSPIGSEPPPEAEQLEEAKELNRAVRKAALEFEDASERAKKKKKALETAQEELNDFLAALDEVMPLFDRKPEPPAAAVSLPPTGWEGTRLDTIDDFPAGPLAALDEIDIRHLGELAEFTKTKQLTEVKGIGPAKAEKVENALAAFWKAWSEKYPEKNTENGQPAE